MKSSNAVESSKPNYIQVKSFLKDKFSKNWISVRKAFLDLDSDYDGFITVDDIIRYFGTEN